MLRTCQPFWFGPAYTFANHLKNLAFLRLSRLQNCVRVRERVYATQKHVRKTVRTLCEPAYVTLTIYSGYPSVIKKCWPWVDTVYIVRISSVTLKHGKGNTQ